VKPQKRGDLTEAAILNGLMENGFAVSQPFDDNQRYDFIVDDDGELYRVQAKTARLKEDKLIFDCANTVANTVEMTKKTYDESDIDVFVVYSPDLDKLYWVPVTESPKSSMTLRIEGKHHKSNYAEDYRL